MAGYNYVAMNRQGKKVNGAIEAKDESDLRRQLKSQGLAVVSIKKGKGIGAKKKAGFLKNAFLLRIGEQRNRPRWLRIQYP